MATGFFIGYSPIAPATFSCALSIIIWIFLSPYKIVYSIVAATLLVIGFFTSNDLAQEWGKDPRQIVIDEYSAFLIPLFFTPLRLLPLLISFMSFRVFDILKPPPLKQFEKLPGGWGIMLDDIGAAVYTSIVVLTVIWIFKI